MEEPGPCLETLNPRLVFLGSKGLPSKGFSPKPKLLMAQVVFRKDTAKEFFSEPMQEYIAKPEHQSSLSQQLHRHRINSKSKTPKPKP